MRYEIDRAVIPCCAVKRENVYIYSEIFKSFIVHYLALCRPVGALYIIHICCELFSLIDAVNGYLFCRRRFWMEYNIRSGILYTTEVINTD